LAGPILRTVADCLDAGSESIEIGRPRKTALEATAEQSHAGAVSDQFGNDAVGRYRQPVVRRPGYSTESEPNCGLGAGCCNAGDVAMSNGGMLCSHCEGTDENSLGPADV